MTRPAPDVDRDIDAVETDIGKLREKIAALRKDRAPEPVEDYELVGADGGPAGGGWMTLGSIVLDHAGVRLTLRTADGQKRKLMLMSGSGVFGKLGGGESQRAGAEALGRWLADADDAAGS